MYRSKVTGLLQPLIACSIAIGMMIGVSGYFFPLTRRIADVVTGKKVFQVRCSGCHAVGQDTQTYGPSLHNVGEWAGSRMAGVSAEEYILTSVLRPSAYRSPTATGVMPENISRRLSKDELLSVTAYLCSQGGTVSYRRLLERCDALMVASDGLQKAVTLDVSSIERGKELYVSRLGCLQCHVLDGYPGHDLRAPSLLSIGNHLRSYLEESIEHASRQIAPGYEEIQVVARGVPHFGRGLQARDGSMGLLELNSEGTLDVLEFSSDEAKGEDSAVVVERTSESAMPSYENSLSREELQSLLDFLCTLRGDL